MKGFKKQDKGNEEAGVKKTDAHAQVPPPETLQAKQDAEHLAEQSSVQPASEERGSAADPLKELKEKAQKADEYYDNYLRAVAELDNYRKRAIKERQHEVEAVQNNLLRGLLPIVDNLERALAQIKEQADSKNMQEGLGLISRQLHTFLDSVGLTPMACVGQQFDPHKHEAVLHVPSKDHPDHYVLEEVQKGYTLHGRVIRHAVVKVVDNPATNAPE